jgi:hypothetical protein
MSETTDRTPVAGPQRPRWTRTRTIWSLIVLSLAPGAAVGAAREWWQQLPAGVRLSAYIISGILLMAACSLLLGQGDTRRDEET